MIHSGMLTYTILSGKGVHSKFADAYGFVWYNGRTVLQMK